MMYADILMCCFTVLLIFRRVGVPSLACLSADQSQSCYWNGGNCWRRRVRTVETANS